jgi:hypothetical protein
VITGGPKCTDGVVAESMVTTHLAVAVDNQRRLLDSVSAYSIDTGKPFGSGYLNPFVTSVVIGSKVVLDVNEPFGVRPVACPLVDSAWFNVAQSHNFSVRVALVTGDTEVIDLTQPEDPDPDPTLDRDLGRSSGHPCNLQAIRRASSEQTAHVRLESRADETGDRTARPSTPGLRHSGVMSVSFITW